MVGKFAHSNLQTAYTAKQDIDSAVARLGEGPGEEILAPGKAFAAGIVGGLVGVSYSTRVCLAEMELHEGNAERSQGCENQLGVWCPRTLLAV